MKQIFCLVRYVNGIKKIWMCGGTLEVHPCSRVGHVFRPFLPYSLDGKNDSFLYNTVRTVEVWMDDYKRLFYMYTPLAKVNRIFLSSR